jgi:predicted RNase H-like nuclease (RuvC/YqgF family)
MDQETLLPLHREFTDKERVELCSIKVKKLIRQTEDLQGEITRLKAQNEKLSTQLKETDLQFPSTLYGKDTVSVKSYMRLHRRYQELDTRFWEVVQELNQLKKEEQL